FLVHYASSARSYTISLHDALPISRSDNMLRVSGPEKRIEDAYLFVFRDADAFILNLKDEIAGFDSSSQPDAAACRRILDGIRHQIGEDAIEEAKISRNLPGWQDTFKYDVMLLVVGAPEILDK